MKALRTVGVPYTDAQITAAADEVKGKTELDALIAYLQVMGTCAQVREGRHMDITTMRIVATLASMVCFIGIWAVGLHGPQPCQI